MSSTTPNPSRDVDADADASVIEADAAARKQYAKMLRRLAHFVVPAVAGLMAVMVMSGMLSIIGTMAAVVLPLSIPAVAGLIWLYHRLYTGRRITRNRIFFMRAVVPMLVMLGVIILCWLFVPLSRIVTWIVGEKHSPVAIYGYPGLPFLVALALLWAVFAVGMYQYINLFMPLTNRKYSLATTKRRVGWFVRMVLATLPWLILMGAHTTSQL